MNDEDKFKTPEVSAGDAVHAVARSGLGVIPFAGTAAIEILNAIFPPK